ncbi:MAG: hypothetical protein WBD20_23910 [Pirellulaceae bacterium]
MEDYDEQRRQLYEKRILIAIIVGPLLLWFFRSGLYLAAIDLLKVASHLFCKYAVAVLAEMFFALALLSVWRHPFARRPFLPTIVVFLFAVSFAMVGNTIVARIFVFPDFYWNPFYTYELISRTLLLAICLAAFVLIRRFTGACLIADDVATIPHRSPLSIAEMMYWTALVAIFCMTASRLSPHLEALGATVPVQLTMIMLPLGIGLGVGPTLIITMLPGSLWVRLIIASIMVTAIWTARYLAYAIHFGIPVHFPDFELLQATFFHVAGPALAFGWVRLRGDRYIRMKRRSDIS